MRKGDEYEDRSGFPGGSLMSFPTAQGDGSVALPREPLFGTRLTLPRPRGVAMRPIYGSIALWGLVAACLAVVVVASAIPTNLVQTSGIIFPDWMAGPLHGLFSGPLHELIGKAGFSANFSYAFSALFLLMLLAYSVVLASARTLSMRAITIAIAAMYAFILLSPQLELSDLFNYIGYARLGALHGLNPYTHVIGNELYDPVSLFATWHHWSSPYGPLFTLLTYPLGGMPLSGAYWVMKLLVVAFSAGFVALVWLCARQLGHDPRFAVLFVAVNPVVLIYEIGGFHNDPVMLVPMLGAISLLLAGRYRWAGVALAAAIAVKFTAALLLPFLLVAAWRKRKGLELLIGVGLGGIPLAVASVAAFGLALPNAADQTTIVTPLSVVNLAGVIFHLGGATSGVEVASKVVLTLAVAVLVLASWRRDRPDWLSGAGWATLTLLLCMSWLMPWYVIWALPLAALSTSSRLRRATLAFTAFAALTFLPVTGTILADLHVSTMRTHADHKAQLRLAKLMR
jgi:Glycosyltransferase family 87